MQDACTEGQTNSLLSNQLAANQCNVTVIITDLEISPPNDKTGTHIHFVGMLSPESSYSIVFENVCTVISVNMQRPPMKSVAQLRKNRSRVLWEFVLVLVLLKSFKFGSLLMS